MTSKFCIGFVLLAAAAAQSAAQSEKRAVISPRVIVTSTIPPAKPKVTAPAEPTPTPIIVPRQIDPPRQSNLTYRGMSFAQIKSKIAEAKRQMQSRPLTIASVEPSAISSQVRIAYYDWKLQQIDYIVIGKDQFLTNDTPVSAASTRGKLMTTRTLRANGVNTPIVVLDENGQPQLPLIVQYPVEKGGRYIETAYYMSTHPGLVTPEVVSAGRFYVRNVIDIARDRLKTRGITIQPRVADIAERLAAVEHVDHLRFRTEYAPNIFNDVYALYALNEGQTFRYSVSSAGAGGMVQMIPSTYSMIRSRYPGVGLIPDFVEGMRNHTNAAQAMLLYMQMTWSYLMANPSVAGAFQNGIATQDQLMAAGYNSNPSRIAGYIDRAGGNWTSLIPRETKTYLQVYDALQRAVPVVPRAR
jgi:hypothetical protein